MRFMGQLHGRRQWRDVRGYEGIYRVSSDGLVASCERTIMRRNGRAQHLAEQLRRPVDSGDGVYVVLFVAGKVKTKCVARLVLEAFRGDRGADWFALHRDGDHANNRLKNLFWGTAAQRDALAVRERRAGQEAMA